MGLERLAVMFGGTVDYRAGRGGCPADAVNRVEIAGMLAGMRDHERDFVYAFFGERSATVRLLCYVHKLGVDMARREEWPTPYEVVLVEMCWVAVNEILHNRCKSCNGTGFKKLRACGRCNGLGIASLSGRAIAEMIGVDQNNYVRHWRRRYDCIYVLVQDIQSSVISSIRRVENKDAILLA